MKKERRNKPKLQFPDKAVLGNTWQLRAGNGKIMASGRWYSRRSDAKRAAWIVRWLFKFGQELNPYGGGK